MWRSTRNLMLLFALLAMGACTASSGNSGSSRPRGDRNLLTQEQIRESNHQTLYDVVQSLRSNWLHDRGVDSFSNPTQILVYMDDVRLGGVETLRSIPTLGISYVRWYDGIAASGRWGLDHGKGVIYVSSSPGR